MRTAEEIINAVNLEVRGVPYTADYMDNHLLQQMVNTARKETIEEVGKKFFYAGFQKCKNDDANCFTAWREEAANLFSIIDELK